MNEDEPNAESSDAPEPESRRSWLTRIGAALGGLAAAAVATPVLGAVLGPLFGKHAEESIDLGPIDDFEVGQTRAVSFTHPGSTSDDGGSAHLSAYVRRKASSEFVVLSPNCTHLGCPVTWFRQSGLFMCPCHGGVYYEDGSRAAGPPPRGLYQYPTKIENRRLKVLGGHLPTLSNTFERSS